MASPETGWETARRVLAVRLDAIGDVLMTGPAIRALAEGPPAREVTLLTSPGGALVAQLMPGVAETIVYEPPWMKATPPRGDASHEHAIVARLAQGRFDAAAIFTVYSQSSLPAALLCHLADIPLRLAHSRDKPYGLLTHWVPEPEPERLVRHEVRRQLELVATVGARPQRERLEIEVASDAREAVKSRLEEAGIGEGRRWAVVHAGSTAPSRRYPPELWAEVCRLLAGQDVALVFTGDGQEVELAAQVRAAAGGPGLSLAGELSLAELAALLAAAPLLLAGNTGPVHLAAAVGTPVVDLYALTNPQHTPWQVPAHVLFEDVPCRWCHGSICREGHHRCLRDVDPRTVAEAALSLLRGEPAPEASLPLGAASTRGAQSPGR